MFDFKSKKTMKKSLVSVIMLFIFLPFFVFSSHSGDIYVNAKASGTQNGSKSHPFRTINQALEKADSGDKIHVAQGEYEENITLKKNIKLYGEDKNNTIIKAKKDKWSTVFVENDSKIDNFTIKGGENGIWVERKAEFSVSNCILKSNNQDGIAIEGDEKAKDSRKVSISKTEIKYNGISGIYVQRPRRVIVTDSEIRDNAKNGISLSAGTSAWLEGNLIKNNGASGLKIDIGGVDIWSKKNSFRQNAQSGIEISYFGGDGKVNVSKSKFVANGYYAISRIQRNVSSARFSAWKNNLIVEENNKFWESQKGEISDILNKLPRSKLTKY